MQLANCRSQLLFMRFDRLNDDQELLCALQLVFPPVERL